MKKSSKEIYKEIQVEKTIESLGENKEKFKECIKGLTNLQRNDFECFYELKDFINTYPQLEEHITYIFEQMALKILKDLNITIDQFKEKLDEIEGIKI